MGNSLHLHDMHTQRLGQLFVLTSALIFATVVLGIAAGYRVNVTPSLPLGLYRVSTVQPPLHRGDLVTFDLSTEFRLHLWLGSFTKPIGALAGDRVCVHEGRLLIEGKDYGPVLDHAPAHAIPGGTCLTVGEGELFTASVVPRSYDSRYFGMIPLVDVQRSVLVWTWEASQ